MLYKLKRHPMPVTAFFRQSLVLTYAYPADLLRPLLPPGLALDTYEGQGFLAIALVEAERMRPSALPTWLGRDCHLIGYRIFARFGSDRGSLRGLRILRSATDRRWMKWAGNLLTHYQYRLADVSVREAGGSVEWRVRTPGRSGDLDVLARAGTGSLPSGSPFASIADARRFAGPLPYTFDYEKETHSIIRIRGVRREWSPRPVDVEVRRNAFLEQEPFCGAPAVLANAFSVRELPYEWERGVRVSCVNAA